MGKFFNQKVKGNRNTLIKYGIIGVAILIIIILFIAIVSKGGQKKVTLELKDEIFIEIGSNLPSTEELFNKIENFDVEKINVDFSGVDINVIGTYEIMVNPEGYNSGSLVCNVIDQTAPTLVLKDVEITKGEKYVVTDFIESCTDNSNTECTYEFWQGAMDINNNPIDYSSFTEENAYIVKIVAYDQSGNSSEIQSANLVIGKTPAIEPIVCDFGDLTYSLDQYSFPLAYVVGNEDTGCALNRNLFDDPTTQAPADEFANQDIEKLKETLKKQLDTAYPNTSANIRVDKILETIWNTENTGLVGYGIYIKVYVDSADSDKDITSEENLKLAYYLKRDGSRDYRVNEYNLN